jgi:hypothetical protein
MALKIIQTHRESNFIGRIETQILSDSDGREKHLPGLTKRCHGLRRIYQSFRGFEEI